MIRPTLALLILALAAGTAAGVPRHIEMTAKQWEFSPAALELVAGEPVILTITSLDRKHGFAVKELDLEGTILPETPLVLEFTPTTPGTFEFRCSHFCGRGHRKMKGTLVVTPAPAD